MDKLFSVFSLALSALALYVSWRAFRRSADAQVVNLSVELGVPPEHPTRPDDPDHVQIRVRNRSLFDVEIECLYLDVNDEYVPLQYPCHYDRGANPPVTLEAKHALDFHIVNDEWEIAIDQRFDVKVLTGSGE